MVRPGVSVISISRLQALGLVSESLDLLYLLPELSPCKDVRHPPQGRESCALRKGPCPRQERAAVFSGKSNFKRQSSSNQEPCL